MIAPGRLIRTPQATFCPARGRTAYSRVHHHTGRTACTPARSGSRRQVEPRRRGATTGPGRAGRGCSPRDRRRRRAHVGARARACAPAGSRSARGRGSSHSASSGIGRWFGTPTGVQRARDQPRRHVHERAQVVLDLILDAQRVAQVADARDLRGREHEQQRRASSTPNHAHGRRRAVARPGASASRTRRPRRGSPRSPRAAAGSGRGSAGRPRRARRTPSSARTPATIAEPHAVAQPQPREDEAADRADAAPARAGSRRGAAATVSGTSPEAGHAAERLRGVARPGQRVQRVAGDRPSRSAPTARGPLAATATSTREPRARRARRARPGTTT